MKKITLFVLVFTLTLGMSFAGTSDTLDLKNTVKLDLPIGILKKSKGRGSDDIKGKMVFTAGVGFNTTTSLTAARYEVSSYWVNTLGNSATMISQKSIPLINFMFDYGIGSKVTIGLGFGYQTMTFVWGNSLVSYTDNWTRYALALRGDYRILARENIGMYTGLRIGYNFYSMTSTATAHFDPNYVSNLSVQPTAVAVQAHFGFSYYFNGMIGANVEVGLAIGGPYYSAVGLTFKL
jgi:hypothetical protein